VKFKVLLYFLGVGLVSQALAMSDARAGTTILNFGQANNKDLFVGTRSGSSTSLAATDVPIIITQIDSNVVSSPLLAYFTLNATSVGTATIDAGNHVQQNYDGSFSIYSKTGKTGTDYLSGQFQDTVFGGGTSLTMSASTAGGSSLLTFQSDVITLLGPDRSLSLGLSLASPISIKNGTLDSFKATVSGNFSASVPEPSSIVILGIGVGVLGIGAGFRRRGRSSA
jgi:hypothetical protein